MPEWCKHLDEVYSDISAGISPFVNHQTPHGSAPTTTPSNHIRHNAPRHEPVYCGRPKNLRISGQSKLSFVQELAIPWRSLFISEALNWAERSARSFLS